MFYPRKLLVKSRLQVLIYALRMRGRGSRYWLEWNGEHWAVLNGKEVR